jgi:hypothetical protein
VRQFDGSLTDTTTRQVNVIQGTYWPIYLPYIAQYIP